MTIENKNFNDDTKNTEMKLSPEQERNFLEYLRRKEVESSKKFTTNEINNLKKEFLDTREKGLEIFSSGDLLKGSKIEKNFGSEENFEKFTKTIDSGVYGYFFGGKGILKDLNISENEKKSFSAGASIYLMDSVYKEVEKTGNFDEIKNELLKLLGNDKEKGELQNLGDSLSGNKTSPSISMIKDLLSGDVIKVFGKIYNPEKLNEVSESFKETELKNNQIFTTPKETFNFFENIFKNNSDKNTITNYIKSKNSDQFIYGNKDDFKEIGDKLGNFITPEIGNALGKVGDVAELFGKTKEKIKDNISGNKEILQTLGMLSSLPLIGDFIKMFFNFLGMDLEEINAGYKEKTEKIKLNISSKESFLEGVKFDEKFAKKSDGKYDADFINTIISISGNKNENDLDKDLEKLFKKGGDFEIFIKNEKLKQIPNFGEKNILKNNNGEIIFENFSYLSSLYKEFLESKNNGINSIEDFVNKKLQENKKIEDEINGGGSEQINTPDSQNQTTENIGEQQNNSQGQENLQQQGNTNSKVRILGSPTDSQKAEAGSIGGDQNSGTNNNNNNVSNNNNNSPENTNTTQQKTDSGINNQTTQNVGAVAGSSALAGAVVDRLMNDQKSDNNNNNNIPKQEPKQTNSNNQQIKKPDDKQEVKSSPKLNENFVIKKNEGIEINNDKANLVFDLNGKKFEASVYNNGALTIVGEGKKIIFSGPKELYSELSKFSGILDKNATASDFGKNVGPINPDLGKTIRHILINGFEDKPGLKSIISEKFFNNGAYKQENISINFSDKNYNFKFEKVMV